MTGAAVAVWRRTETGIEWLVLHRCHSGTEFTGDWAWGPPGGGCYPDESSDACARRELAEETGLDADVVRTHCGNEAARRVGGEFVLFHAEVPVIAEVALSSEHDAYRWLPLGEARSSAYRAGSATSWPASPRCSTSLAGRPASQFRHGAWHQTSLWCLCGRRHSKPQASRL